MSKSLEWYKTAVLAELWNEQARQKVAWETPWFNMMDAWQTPDISQASSDIGRYAKDREVELGIWKPVWPKMSDAEKQSYVDSLSDYQYHLMTRYRDEWYSFEAAKTLLENQSKLYNANWNWYDKYTKWGWLSNIVWWAYDSVTWIPRFIANNVANAIWWTAKQLWADEDKVDYLVQNYKDYLNTDWSGQSIWADTSSGTYKVSKWVSDIAQTFAYWALWKAGLESKLWAPLATASDPLRAKATAWAVEWAADMWIYSLVSDSELPSGWELTLWGLLWAAFPIWWAVVNAWKKAAKEWAVKVAEDLVWTLNKLPQRKQKEFLQMIWEKATKWMNDRWIKDWEWLIDYFTRSIGKVDEALEAIQGNFRSQQVEDVLNDAIWFASETLDPQLNRLIELSNKHSAEWLTMKEINEVKRRFERNNKFTYLNKWTGEQAKRATNLDSALREWQRSVAEKNWFANLAELNKETQAAKYLLNNTFDVAELGSKNPMDFTDWIVAAWSFNGKWLSNLVKKQIVESARFRRYAIDILNKVWGKKTIEEAMADLDAIAKMNDKKMVEAYMTSRWYNDVPKLEVKEWVKDINTIIHPDTTIIAAPSWEAVLKQKYTDIPRVD